MRFPIKAVLILALFGPVTSLQAGSGIEVMTQNQYLGGDLAAVVQASDPSSFNAAIVSVLGQIAANDFPARVVALAGQIADRRPHLVGLQEVFAFGCAPLVPGGCEDPRVAGAFNDHLDMTLAALTAQGVDYTVAARVDNLSLAGIPIDLDAPGPGAPFRPDIRVSVLDRDVILARADVPTTRLPGTVIDGGLCGFPAFPPTVGVSTPSADGCNFAVIAAVPSPVGRLDIERGFVAVDAQVGGRVYRFVNTHLEVRNPAPVVQALQAMELLATVRFLTPSSITLLVAGDINSSPEDLPFVDPKFGPIAPPYLQLVLAGMADQWVLRPGNPPGFTCCQASDLANRTSIADERIDIVFSREPPAGVKANLLGIDPSERTKPARLWPSDHATLAVSLSYD